MHMLATRYLSLYTVLYNGRYRILEKGFAEEDGSPGDGTTTREWSYVYKCGQLSQRSEMNPGRWES